MEEIESFQQRIDTQTLALGDIISLHNSITIGKKHIEAKEAVIVSRKQG